MASQLSDPAVEEARLFRPIAETIPHMVWVTAADGSAEYFNARLLEYTGRRASDLAGWGWSEILHPEDRERVLTAWQQAAGKGERYAVECRLRRSDGAYRWHHVAALPTLDAEGRVAHWFGTCTDIEDHISELAKSEARFRALTKLSSDLYWETDTEYRFTDLVFGPRAMSSVPVEEQLGKTRWEVPHTSPGEEGWAAHRATIAARLPFSDFELSRIVPSGEERFYSVNGEPVFDEAGNFTGYRGVGSDITERKRAERALRESERRFQLFMENSPAVAWIKDSRLRYTYVSIPYEKLLGIRPADFIGHDDFEVWNEEMARRLRRNDEEVLRTGAPLQTVETSVDRAGHERQWLVVKFLLADASGSSGVAGMAIEITERIEAEERARAYAADIRELMNRLIATQEDERRRVAGDLHDLIGQNLSALGISLSTLTGKLLADEAARVSPSLKDMAELVERTVLAIRGLMTELRPPALESCGLAAALREHAAELSARSPMQVTVEALESERRFPEEAELALFRIAQEALTNAAKHSGGRSVSVSLTQDAERIRLVVEDDGRGFAEPAGARRAHRGGWGLPAMRERAEALGGSLRIEFPGRGTRVIAELPLLHGD